MTDAFHWLAGGIAAAAASIVAVPYVVAVGWRIADAFDLTHEPYDPTAIPFPPGAVDTGAAAALAAAVAGIAYALALAAAALA